MVSQAQYNDDTEDSWNVFNFNFRVAGRTERKYFKPCIVGEGRVSEPSLPVVQGWGYGCRSISGDHLPLVRDAVRGSYRLSYIK